MAKKSQSSDVPSVPPAAAGKPRFRLEWIAAGSLNENPANWRKHPESQTSALKALISDPEIGWAGACLYNERTHRLIDGHARRDVVDPATPIPVLVGDWSEEAERKILLTLNPLAAMAETNLDALQALHDQVDLSAPAFAGLGSALEGLANEAQRAALAAVDDDKPATSGSSGRVSNAGKDVWKIVITCKSEADQTRLLKRFTKEKLECRALVG